MKLYKLLSMRSDYTKVLKDIIKDIVIRKVWLGYAGIKITTSHGLCSQADPYIYKHESGMYYFTASVPAYDKIILRESDTLEGLADATEHEIWYKHDTGIMGNHIWALPNCII